MNLDIDYAKKMLEDPEYQKNVLPMVTRPVNALPDELWDKYFNSRQDVEEIGGGMPLLVNRHRHIPPFVRMAWVSEAAKAAWEPKIRLARQTSHIMEKIAVVAGLRRATTDHFRPDQLPSAYLRYGKLGLAIVPIRLVGVYNGFAHSHPPVESGRPWDYFCAVARNYEDALAWANAHEHGDHDLMGDYLGYPSCCRTFFTQVWSRGYIDPIWQAAINTKREHPERVIYFSEEDRTIFLKPNPSSLSVLRYIGVRLAPQIVHSMSCDKTEELATKWEEAAIKYREAALETWGVDIVEGWQTMKYLLSLPIKWEVLHGIAEVTTPLFKFATNSVFTPLKYTVLLEKQDDIELPEEAAYGIGFPFKRRSSAVWTLNAEELLASKNYKEAQDG